MSVFIINLVPSKEEILAGVPRYLQIVSNIPATIYYTLDGTTPTLDSPIYTGTITMPVDDLVVVSAFGIDSLNNNSPVITQIFGPFFYGINKGSEGIVVDGPIIPLSEKIIDGYNADSKPIRFLDIPRIELQLVHSHVGFDGAGRGDATNILEPTEIQEPGLIEDQDWVIFTTTEKAQFFNPYAKNIIIDGRKDNEVFFLNRPFGTMRNDKKFDGGKNYRISGLDDNYISGGFTNHFYDKEKKILVSYYRDTNSLTMVKSIQPYVVNRVGVGPQRFYGMPLVFQWLPRGKQATY